MLNKIKKLFEKKKFIDYNGYPCLILSEDRREFVYSDEPFFAEIHRRVKIYKVLFKNKIVFLYKSSRYSTYYEFDPEIQRRFYAE